MKASVSKGGGPARVNGGAPHGRAKAMCDYYYDKKANRWRALEELEEELDVLEGAVALRPSPEPAKRKPAALLR